MQEIFAKAHRNGQTEHHVGEGRQRGAEGGGEITPSAASCGSEPGTRSKRWGLILAGGNGNRLQSLTRTICGDDRPKQFCRLFGEGTLLEQTLKRAERSIASQQIFIALSRTHERYYPGSLDEVPHRKLVQPCDKGTAPPIVYSLSQIAKLDRDAVVAILPCDHYFSDESLFTRALESAFEAARVRPQSVVLLGAEPTAPEVDYGWIEVGPALGETIFEVLAFHEKPSFSVAQHLLQEGALWSTFVMVGHIGAFFRMTSETVPGLLEVFQTTMKPSHGRDEIRIPEALYDWVVPSDFSRQVLAPSAKDLVALWLDGLEWQDLGHPDRVLSTWLARSSQLLSPAESSQATEKDGR